jgi:hypothetical protein
MRTKIAILLVAVIVLVGFFLGRASAKAGGIPQGQAQTQSQAPVNCTIQPIAGSFKGLSVDGHQLYLVFEDPAETIRIYNGNANKSAGSNGIVVKTAPCELVLKVARGT